MTPLSAVLWLWGIWFVSWMLAASWSNPTRAKPRFGTQRIHGIVTLAGMLLLFSAQPTLDHGPRLWRIPWDLGWGLAGVAVLGFALCWWARIHLGRMWSISVTLKADHHIVDTGPYALVRHPIYTGLILASAATAALEAKAVSFAGLVLIILGFWIKARLEERFLREELGPEAYDAYASRTGMLFPDL